MENRDDKKRFVMKMIKNRPAAVREALRAATKGKEGELEDDENEDGAVSVSA